MLFQNKPHRQETDAIGGEKLRINALPDQIHPSNNILVAETKAGRMAKKTQTDGAR
jgi:hypothetical protein